MELTPTILRRLRKVLLAISPAVIGIVAGEACAATANTNLGVTLTISAQCVVAGGAVAFGPQGVLSSIIDSNGSFSVTCTSGTPYSIGLDQGLFGLLVSARKMRSSTTGAEVSYALYLDAARTLNWGNLIGSLLSNTGTGDTQTINVYGRILPQATPAAASDYTDTVTISVSY
ncbi:MAG: spore coat U domain-containing protein [Siculibacillus sp.]|nr:spore coat U domain-containing protein [Siculibacillus sp.]